MEKNFCLVMFIFVLFQAKPTMTRPCIHTNPPLPKYNLHVLNAINTKSNLPLLLHCATDDYEDFGNQTLNYGEQFSFSICKYSFGARYYCVLDWAAKNLFAIVFDSDGGKEELSCRSHNCSWAVREDGFYFCGEYPANANGWKQVYSW